MSTQRGERRARDPFFISERAEGKQRYYNHTRGREREQQEETGAVRERKNEELKDEIRTS